MKQYGIAEEETLPKLINNIYKNGKEDDSLGLRNWAYNHWNKNEASFLELKTAYNYMRFGMGDIRAELGHNTRLLPDISIYSPKVNMAVENKNITTARQQDVDQAIREAIEQLSKRNYNLEKVSYTTWIAEIQIENENNLWPYNRTEIEDIAMNKPTGLALGDRAKLRNLTPQTKPARTIVRVHSSYFGRFEFSLL